MSTYKSTNQQFIINQALKLLMKSKGKGKSKEIILFHPWNFSHSIIWSDNISCDYVSLQIVVILYNLVIILTILQKYSWTVIMYIYYKMLKMDHGILLIFSFIIYLLLYNQERIMLNKFVCNILVLFLITQNTLTNSHLHSLKQIHSHSLALHSLTYINSLAFTQ